MEFRGASRVARGFDWQKVFQHFGLCSWGLADKFSAGRKDCFCAVSRKATTLLARVNRPSRTLASIFVILSIPFFQALGLEELSQWFPKKVVSFSIRFRGQIDI